MKRARPSTKRATRIADPRAELAALHNIGAALSAAWDLDTTLHKITETTADVMQMDSCSLYLLDKKQNALVLKASTGLSPAALNVGKLQVGEGITGYAAETGKPVAVRDAANDPHFKYVPGTEEQKFKSLAAVPLISQGKIIGAMNVQTTSFHHWVKPEIDLLALIGELAAGALERAELLDGLQRQVNELSMLAQVSKTITAPIYLDEMLAVICEMAAQIMGAKGASLLLFDEEQDQLALRATYGLKREHAEISPIDVETSLTGRAIMQAQPVVVSDLQQEPLYKNQALAKREGLRSFLSVPVSVRGKTIGAFNCYMGDVHTFTAQEIELFSTLANQTALALENANLAMSSMVVREMHHRIKNNLQTVAMLLRLQMREPESGNARVVLQQTYNRIMSIAAVHEQLSQEGFRLIGVRGLIQQAAYIAKQNMVHPDKEIQVNIEGVDLRLPSQPATTVAIAVNELVQNALEHGLDKKERGVVNIILNQDDAFYEIRVEDDGAGLPKNFSKNDSLGLQIVENMIVQDLRGEFHIANRRGKRGTVATLKIPKMKVG
ncbi:MAG: GAF domain-containing protein [Chloroflexi bacterium]|nr:GAF domain-containing protein [Chloroflexota bacterium]